MSQQSNKECTSFSMRHPAITALNLDTLDMSIILWISNAQDSQVTQSQLTRYLSGRKVRGNDRIQRVAKLEELKLLFKEAMFRKKSASKSTRSGMFPTIFKLDKKAECLLNDLES